MLPGCGEVRSVRVREGQFDIKSRALIRLADEIDPPAMLCDNGAADTQSQPRTAAAPGIGGIRLGKLFKDLVVKFPGDACPLIDDTDPHTVCPDLGLDLDGLSGSRKFGRIRKQIAKDLVQAG